VRSLLIGVTWISPTGTWAWDLSPPGFFVAMGVMALYVAVAGAITPPNRARRLVMPAAVVLLQWLIQVFPVGGTPVTHLALTQAGSCAKPCAQIDSPLVNAARIGGFLAVTALLVIGGQALHALSRRRSAPGVLRSGLLGAALVVGVTAAGVVAPRGQDVAPIRIAVVQGGGPQRTPPGNADSPAVFDRHVQATRELVKPPVDVVVWPENTVAVSGRFEGSAYQQILSGLARELDTTLIVGITEDAVGEPVFWNASVVINPDGSIGDRYDKVHRVPFGEYVPARSLIEKVAPPGSGLPERDAVAGTGSGRLHTNAGDFGIVISFEDFFEDRARSSVADGGEVLLNPTNGASYWLTQVQTQQIASSRLRAIENGRWHVQAAPTGFSSVITPDGVLLSRTDVSERQVLQTIVQRRSGSTVASVVGPWPVLGLSVVVLAAGWRLSRRSHLRRARSSG
jgi:apolipoprotein N-acyltransferase